MIEIKQPRNRHEQRAARAWQLSTRQRNGIERRAQATLLDLFIVSNRALKRRLLKIETRGLPAFTGTVAWGIIRNRIKAVNEQMP